MRIYTGQFSRLAPFCNISTLLIGILVMLGWIFEIQTFKSILLRANINRLIRKTWCTTKNIERLQMHLDFFIDFYNQDYLKSG